MCLWILWGIDILLIHFKPYRHISWSNISDKISSSEILAAIFKDVLFPRQIHWKFRKANLILCKKARLASYLLMVLYRYGLRHLQLQWWPSLQPRYGPRNCIINYVLHSNSCIMAFPWFDAVNSLRPGDAYICVNRLTNIGSHNGLSSGRRQAIIWTNAGTLLIGPLGTNFSEILIAIYTFSFSEMHLKMWSGKCRPFSSGLNVLEVFEV